MMEHMEWKDFIETSRFKKLTFDQLLDLRIELEGAWTELNFFDDPKDLRKKLIDNPLKILDFISETVRDSNVREKARAIKSL
jgi:hypothetical protein